jgi:hypothetical protein
MRDDPGERENIATDPANSELIETLAALLRERGEGLLRLQGGGRAAD